MNLRLLAILVDTDKPLDEREELLVLDVREHVL